MTRAHSTLDRSSDTALWRQLAETLAGELDAGRWAVGERLASESALTTRFGVSRVTLRQALTELAARGLIHPRAGKGWYVGSAAEDLAARPLQEPPGVLQSYTEMARSRGLTPDSTLLHCAVRPAEWTEATTLAIAPGAPLLSLRRLRRLDGLPVAVDHSLVPAALLPGIDGSEFITGSLFDAFRRRGIRPTRADYEVHALAADAEHARLLELAPGAPLLSAEQVLQDATGRRIEIGQITYRGDRYRFRAVLQA